MTIPNPHHKKGGRPAAIPILRAEIEEAQRHTNSNAAAARYLNVSYRRYKQYAQLYGLFERHLNVRGIGIEKGFSKRPTSIPLRDILSGKHPTYSLSKLKNRLIARKKIVEECTLCGFHEQRITDKKVPLLLTFKDGNRQNFQLDNLTLLCYNCLFLTTGAPSVVNRGTIKRSLTHPDTIHKYKAPEPTTADHYDPLHDLDLTLTPDELATLLNETSHATDP